MMIFQHFKSKKNAQLSILVSAATLLTLTQACKPAQKSKLDSQALSEQQSLQNMKTLIDTGLAQLDEEFKALDEVETGNSALGLTNSTFSGSTKVTYKFKQIFQKVSSTWNSFQGNPCRIWTPIMRNLGKHFPTPYFFMGASVEAGAGLHGVVGRDYVWDLYNLQLAAFNYRGLEVVFGSGTVGAGMNSYIGLGFGKKNDVNEAWSGRFASTGFSGSLPVLSDYLSGHISYFSSENAQGRADNRFLGGSIGVSAAVSAPVGLPGAVQVASGNWVIDKKENIKLSQRLKSFGIKNSMEGSATCQGACVRIDNIARGSGYLGRAVNLASSIALIGLNGHTGLMAQGLDKILLLAIATGAYRDNQNNAHACKI